MQQSTNEGESADKSHNGEAETKRKEKDRKQILYKYNLDRYSQQESQVCANMYNVRREE